MLGSSAPKASLATACMRKHSCRVGPRRARPVGHRHERLLWECSQVMKLQLINTTYCSIPIHGTSACASPEAGSTFEVDGRLHVHKGQRDKLGDASCASLRVQQPCRWATEGNCVHGKPVSLQFCIMGTPMCTDLEGANSRQVARPVEGPVHVPKHDG